MNKAVILQLVQELQSVLEEPRAREVKMAADKITVVVTTEAIENANESSSSLRRSLELAARILEHCLGSRGLQDYLLQVVDELCRAGVPAADIVPYFGALHGNWNLFDPEEIEEMEYRYLQAATISLFCNLLASLRIYLDVPQIRRLTADSASQLFENQLLSAPGSWFTAQDLNLILPKPIPELWGERFAPARRILDWCGSFQARYRKAPANFADVECRLIQFLEYEP